MNDVPELPFDDPAPATDTAMDDAMAAANVPGPRKTVKKVVRRVVRKDAAGPAAVMRDIAEAPLSDDLDESPLDELPTSTHLAATHDELDRAVQTDAPVRAEDLDSPPDGPDLSDMEADMLAGPGALEDSIPYGMPSAPPSVVLDGPPAFQDEKPRPTDDGLPTVDPGPPRVKKSRPVNPNTLPVATTGNVTQVSKPTQETMPHAEGEGVPIDRRWDEMMETLTFSTREAIFASGINAVSQFCSFAPSDLLRPRGVFNQQQLDEVQAFLALHGKKMQDVSTIRKRSTPVRAARAHILSPLGPNATPREKRRHRILSNRLTF